VFPLKLPTLSRSFLPYPRLKELKLEKMGNNQRTRKLATKMAPPVDRRKKQLINGTWKRPPTFDVCPPLESQVTAAEELLENESKHQNHNIYVKFCHLRDMIASKRAEDHQLFQCGCKGDKSAEERRTCLCSCIKCFVTQGNDHSLNPGTLSTYLSQVISWSKINLDVWTASERLLIHQFRDIHQHLYAMSKPDCGTAVTKEEGDNALAMLDGEGLYNLSCMLDLMALLGVRFEELCELSYSDMRSLLRERGMRFTTVGGKTTATQKRPAESALSLCILEPPAGYRHLEQRMKRHGPTSLDKPFHGYTTGGACDKMGGLELGCRTQNFRKHFAARMYVVHDGDLEKVSQALGHTNKTIAGGFYLTLDNEPCVNEYKDFYGK
jgi:hypothetical protein